MMEEVPEEYRKRSLIATMCAPTTEYIERFSSLAKLARVTLCAACLNTLFLIPTRRKQVILKHQLTLYDCIFTVQNAVYHGERADLISQEVKKCNELHSLCPFLDKHEMLPVGGRLKNSSLPYKTQYQVIQPSRHHLTEIE